MCDHENREAAMIIVSDGVWCDPCLVPLVKALNEGGLPTVASCCGHGKRPGKVSLADGRELFLLPNFEAARALDDHFHYAVTGPRERSLEAERGWPECATYPNLGCVCRGALQPPSKGTCARKRTGDLAPIATAPDRGTGGGADV